MLFILILASILEILVSALRQEKIIKGTHFRKNEVKLSLQANWRLFIVRIPFVSFTTEN